MNKKIILLGIVPLLLLAAFVFAQTGDLDIEEDSLNFTKVPGDVFTSQFTINNIGNDTLFNISVIEIGDISPLELGILSDIFDVNESEIVGFNITVPAGTSAGNYSTTIKAETEDKEHSDTFELNIEINEVKGVNIEGIGSVTMDLDVTKTIKFNITNTGNVDLYNLSISKAIDDNIDDGYYEDFTLALSETLIDLPAGMSYEIELTITTDDNTYVFDDYNWDIKVSNAEVSDIATLEVSVENEVFDVSDFEVKDSDLKPGETFEISFDIENIASEDIEDITAGVYILNMEDEDGDDLNDKISEFDLDTGKKRGKSFDDFKVPYNIETGDYIIELNIDGDGKESEDNIKVNFLMIDELKVEKDDDDDVEFIDTLILPEPVSCGKELTVETTVINIGLEDQDEMYLTLKISDLDIEEDSTTFDLEGDDASSDRDRETDKSFVIDIPKDTAEGTYTMKLYAYSEDAEYLLGSISKTFTVEGSACSDSSDDEEVEISLDDTYISAEQGETVVVEITVTNNGYSEENDFTLKLDGYESWATLIELEQPDEDLEEGESSVVSLTLLIDSDANDGSHKLTITVEEDSEILDTEKLTVITESDGDSSISGEDITGFTSFIDSIENINFSSSLIILGDLLLIAVIIFFIKMIVTKRR